MGQFTPDFPHFCPPGRNGTSCRIIKGIRSCAKISRVLIEAQPHSCANFNDQKQAALHLWPRKSATRRRAFMNRFAFILLKYEFFVMYMMGLAPRAR